MKNPRGPRALRALSRLTKTVVRTTSLAKLRSYRGDGAFPRELHLGLVPMLVVDSDGRLVDANARLCALLGETRAALRGRLLDDLIDVEHRGAAHAALDAVRTGSRDRASFEARFARGDGAIVYAEVSVAPVRRAGGSGGNVIAAVQDLTAQKTAELELTRRNELFKAVVENTPDLVARFDRDLRRQYVNPAIERLTGVPSSALTGKTLAELNFDPRFIREIEGALADVFEKGAETTLEVLLPSSEGERVFHLRVVPERDAAGAVASALVISRDITSIRRDQERLRALTREIELLLASTYEGICATDLTGVCTLVNASAASMLGYAPDEITGRSLHELVHGRHEDGTPYAVEDCPMAKVVVDGQAMRLMREVLWRKDGTSFPVDIFSAPILADDGEVRGAVYSFIDITERENLQEELDQANRLAGLGRVASAMSHEFNNVLMGIQPFAEVLLRASGGEREVKAATRIIESVRRGREITEDLRAFTRPAPPRKTPTDAREWLSDCAAGLRPIVPSNVMLEVDIAGASGRMDVDPEAVRQALTNIVRNACDAIGNAGGIITMSARITRDRERLQSEEPFVQLSVSDDGPGIEPRSLPRLFEPFYTTRKGGRGLGLAIARQIITLHGGRVFVDSELGKGTTVHVFLPASAGTHTLRAVPSLRPAAGGRWPERVLLVEDDEAVASGVAALLEDEKVNVRVAADGAAAIAILHEFAPQALVIDINLPDCSGFDLYERITAEIGVFPVVFASGHADAARLESMRTPAGVRMLTKPYAIDALLEMLESLAPATK